MTKTIQLTQGKETIVDDCDLERIMDSGYKWYPHKHKNKDIWYVIGHNGVSSIGLHHFIVGKNDNGCIDHADRNGLNNTRSNLRFATLSQNRANSKIPINNKTGYKGVRLDAGRKKFSALIRVNKKNIHLGTFDDPKEAGKAYNVAAVKHFGEFARLNDV